MSLKTAIRDDKVMQDSDSNDCVNLSSPISGSRLGWTILHLEASPGWGGQEIRILREAEGMRSRGHSVIFAVMNGGALAKEAQKEGFLVYEMNFKKCAWLVTLPRLLSLIRKHGVSLVNTHSSLDSWVGGAAARLCGVPIVRTRHLSTPNKPGLNSRLLYGKLADFVVTTCASIVPGIGEKSRKPLSCIRSVPTGVDPSRMAATEEEALAFRQSLGISESDFLIGTACFMRSWKGLNEFMDAALLLQGEPRMKWVIIGGGHEEAYRKRAEHLGLGGTLYFTGHLPNPIPAIKGLDAFALLSTAHEGVSQAILQAAYLEKPLIATATGGLSEVCLDGKTGIQVPLFSPEKVAAAALHLMRDVSARRLFGQHAKELVLNQFTLQKTVDEMEDIYQKVMIC